MWIVRLALRRPYTFVVLALLIAVLGILSIVTMPIDIFPRINIPVVTVIWSYSGLSPIEMQNRIVTVSERAFTSTVNGIEHIESVSLRGVAVTRLYFHPNVPIAAAIAEVNAQAQEILRPLPPGIFPPLIIQYNAASVPVVLASLSSDQLAEQELNDLGNSFIRTQLVTIQGAAVPVPYGGKVRVVNVYIDPDALYTRGLSPQDVTNAILTQNIILPAGTAKIGTREYDIALNGSPVILNDLNHIPIRYVNGAMVTVGEVAFVHDGFNPQTNLVRRDGRHSALLPILSNGSASTLTVVDQVRQLMPKILAGLPPSLKVDFLFDQSIFVRAAVTGVLHEGVIAACLTGLMILLFLGSWRSTVIVVTSIPLSILTSIIVLNLLHQSLNVMTLGGLALAVGILVDDATVAIENNHRHLDLGKPLRQAILDGAAEVATPAFVATLSICIVFVPMIMFLDGVGGALFSPLAMFRRVRDARQLLPLEDTRSHDGALPAGARGARAARPGCRPGLSDPAVTVRADLRLLRGRLPQAHPSLRGSARLGTDTHARGDRGVPHLCHRLAVPVPVRRPGLLPDRRCGAAAAPREGPGGDEDRGDRSLLPAGRGLYPPGDPRQRDQRDRRQHRRAESHQPGAQRQCHGRTGRWRDPGGAQRDSPPDRRLLEDAPRPAAATVPGSRVLRPARRHRQPDPQLRPARPHRHTGHGPVGGIGHEFPRRPADRQGSPAVPGAVDVHVQQILDAPRIMIDSDRILAQQVGLTQRDVANSLLISLTGSGRRRPISGSITRTA